MADIDEQFRKAVRDLQAAKEQAKERFSQVQLSNGIVLKYKDIPPAAMRRAMAAVAAPEVPKVFLEDRNEWEENPNDPDYINSLVHFHNARLEVYNRLLLSLGTTFVSVPEGMYGPEDNGWVEEIQFAMPDVELNLTLGITRYWEWLNLYALTEEKDRNAIHAIAFQRSAGIMEAEVEEAYAWFRDAQARRALVVSASTEAHEDGDSLRADGAGDGAGGGGEGRGEGDAVSVGKVAKAPKRGAGRGDRSAANPPAGLTPSAGRDGEGEGAAAKAAV